MEKVSEELAGSSRGEPVNENILNKVKRLRKGTGKKNRDKSGLLTNPPPNTPPPGLAFWRNNFFVEIFRVGFFVRKLFLLGYFYRTQVYLGSDLWVPMPVTE